MSSSKQYTGRIFIISAPTGTGKTTLVKRLVQELSNVKPSISYTTRKPRVGETDGVDYNFIDKNDFEAKIKAGEFLEYVELYGFYYGTSRVWIEEQQQKGCHIVLVIDTQGGLKLKDKIQGTFIFLAPPSLEELRKRLLARQTESLSVIEERLSCVSREIEQGKKYDYKIINEQLDVAYEALKSIIVAEMHRIY
ncbi:guanylate kinase [Neochlamydia sp. EPS4]|uniref:guanylate kinase n=1 Tax=Neochlamydia sp. EPS4 TaxID=1478175 RepID=UPI0005D100BA|nr:guanylate kinase [Neochlamydia sp. EPS4]